VVLRIIGAADPHSGLLGEQMAVGTRPGDTSLLPWTDVPGARIGDHTVYITVPVGLPIGSSLWVQLRAVNGVGMPSQVYGATVTVTRPSTTSTTTSTIQGGRYVVPR
jgi:hypothetical protein